MSDEIYDTYLRVRSHTRNCGLSTSGVMILLSLDKASPQRVSELAGHVDTTQQAMGKMLKIMVALGYVHIKADSEDGRAREVNILRRGRTKVNQIIKKWG